MSIRQVLVCVAFFGAAISPAMAVTMPGGSEAGYIEAVPQLGMPAGTQATTPLVERMAYRRGDVSADGRYVFVGGDGGWTLREHDLVYKGGRFAHTDTCAHNSAKPSLAMSDQERSLLKEQQIGS